jgi:hypothetical protein
MGGELKVTNGKVAGYVREIGQTTVLLNIDTGDCMGRAVRVNDEIGVNYKLDDPVTIHEPDGPMFWKRIPVPIVEMK